MTDTPPIRVLIVDDHPMVRSGLKLFIAGSQEIVLAGEASSGAEAVEFCRHDPPDVIIMDMVMPEMDGSEATRQIVELNSQVKIIVLTSFHEQDLVENALRAGAMSYLLKNVSADELLQAILAAHAGRSILASEAAEALIQRTRQKPLAAFTLSEREKEVLGLMAEGLSTTEIANHLSISIPTVKFHLKNIFSKMGVKNRVEAASLAWQQNLVEKPPKPNSST
jgi:two-component system, NarL family, response regulator LiaR